MTVVKICGITNLADAEVAVEAGADALGFNFYRKSPRYIVPSLAREIIRQLPSNVMSVGVFVNEASPEVVLNILKEAGVTAVQLHGDEAPEYCAAFSEHFVIKALSSAHASRANAFCSSVSALMIDAGNKELPGGTGRLADWLLAAKLRESVPKLFLAGGLSPKNINDAIRSVRPYGVDACSLLEQTPGLKNHDQMRAFLKNVRDVKP